MFIDIAKILVQSGKGGDGKVSFHRQKCLPNGGPDGGDGGKGASVIFMVDDNLSTLMDFRYKRKYLAPNGENGGSAKCFGKDAKNLVIKVPRGTLIRDLESGQVIKDMSQSEPYILAKGGKGGFGNQHFATPTRQTPRFAKPGLPGQTLEIQLELKLLADVGLIGYPNVGKSTLLSMISAARPKIGDYHFTTIVPNLGVVRIGDGASFVASDIPGIIEGAASGAGLGLDFLRHIDRCRLLLHIVDISSYEGRNPIEDFDNTNLELKNYNEKLSKRPQIVVCNKVDALADESVLEEFKAYVTAKGYEVLVISAISNIGLKELVAKTWTELEKLPPVTTYEPEYVIPEVRYSEKDITYRKEEDMFIVEGLWIERLMGSINFDDYESTMYFERMLKKAGIFEKLEEMGINEGEIVSIYEHEFEYVR